MTNLFAIMLRCKIYAVFLVAVEKIFVTLYIVNTADGVPFRGVCSSVDKDKQLINLITL